MNEVLVERSGKVVSVILDRPPVNALTLALYQRITAVFRDISASSAANCVVLTARGDRAFCAGLDLHEFLATSAEDDPKRAVIVRETFRTVRQCAIPVVAAINGPALGAGVVLASVADIRIAAESAKFGIPEINVGRCGGGAHMGRYLPPGRLRRMCFTGEPISAAEALQWGFVDQVVPASDLLPAAYQLAETIASKSPIGLRMAKEALNTVEFMPVEEGYELEQQYSTQLMHTEDAREAARAVVEKRLPIFKGY
jgi:enoyl-CoA hydratase